MKNQAQIERKNSGLKGKTQSITNPHHRALLNLIKIESRATPGQMRAVSARLDDYIREIHNSRSPRVHTGNLVWGQQEYNAAVAAGRFVRVSLTPSQCLQLDLTNRVFTLTAFLRIATADQLEMLRDTAPLYTTEFHDEICPPEVTALRGPGPNGRDLSNTKGYKAIAAELRRRRAPRGGLSHE
jgi:hypothetical protein